MRDDEEDLLSEDLDAYIEAYAEEELAEVDAAAAFAQFERAQQDAPIPLKRRERKRALLFAVAGAALAAGLAGVWLSGGQDLEPSNDPVTRTQAPDAASPPGETHSAVPVDPPRRRRAASNDAPEPETEVEPDEQTPIEPAPLEELAEPTPPKSRRRPKPAPEPVEPLPPAESEPSALARELTTLASLRKALRSKRYGETLKLVREHRSEFPKPTLAAERDLIELEALCALGRTEAVEKARATFASRHPSHHLGSKANAVCKKSSSEAQKTDSPRHEGE